MLLSKAAQFNLPTEWVSRLDQQDPERRQVCVWMYVWVGGCTCVGVGVRVWGGVYVCTCVGVGVSVCLYVCTCVGVDVFIVGDAIS